MNSALRLEIRVPFHKWLNNVAGIMHLMNKTAVLERENSLWVTSEDLGNFLQRRAQSASWMLSHVSHLRFKCTVLDSNARYASLGARISAAIL